MSPLVADPWVRWRRGRRRSRWSDDHACPRRRPWKVAAEASTLQRLSGVRLVLGVGMGVPATFVDGELVVISPADAAALKAAFVASGGPADGDVAIWGGSLPEEVKEYEDAGVTWMFTDGGASVLDELRAFVAAGPPRSGA